MKREDRIRISIPVYVDEKDQLLKTENLSERGCFIKADDPLEEGTRVNLVFHFQKKPIHIRGVVKHVLRDGKDSGMGIEFEDPPKEFTRLVKIAKKEQSFWGHLSKVGTVSSVIKNVFFLLFIFAFLFSVATEKIKNFNFERSLSRLEEKTHQKIITMIHREVRVGLFGIPFKQYIKVKDAEHILREIRETPPDKPIGLIIHTPGGVLFSAFQIARALKEHPGKVTVYVPHYAMSGGTLIALAADEIVMDKNAVLGPVDPQMMFEGNVVPAVSVLNIRKYKKLSNLKDDTLIMYDQARKAVNQVKQMVSYLLSCKEKDKRCERVFSALVKGTVTHDYPVTFEKAKDLGLPVSDKMPKEVYSFLD